MSERPKFTILLPAKGRPALIREALLSILRQSFSDFEVIFSNNGSDPAIYNEISDLLTDSRTIYVEQSNVLPMPDHWERISKLARGEYITVVPDRSVLKQGALTTISELHAEGGSDAEIVTWSWDLYFDQHRILKPFAGNAGAPAIIGSEEAALASLGTAASYPAALPRGLNSSVHRLVLEEIRLRAGAAFSALTPDFSFAFACLLVRPRFTHIDCALSISQGLAVSNGGNAYKSDASSYLGSLGLDHPIRYSPIPLPFVENVIAEDFFAACHRFDRLDLIDRLDRAGLYLRCLAELEVKRNAKLLPPDRLAEFAAVLESALATETAELRARVAAARPKFSIRSALKRVLGDRVEHIRPLLLQLRRGRRFASALEAAGHTAS